MSIARAQSSTLKIGYISCMSGPRTDFGATDPWVLERVKAVVKNGLTIGGKNYAVEFVLKDNQSDANQTNVVAKELILGEKCDLVLTNDAENIAGAADELADARGVPLISTLSPWEAWFFARYGTPDRGFPFTFHYCIGAGDVFNLYATMWNTVKADKIVGTMYMDRLVGAFQIRNVVCRRYSGGPIVGTIVYYGVRELFANLFALSGSWYLIALGSVAVLTMLFAPRGIWPFVRDRLGVEWLSIARKLPTIATEDDAKGSVSTFHGSPFMVRFVLERAKQGSDRDASACFWAQAWALRASVTTETCSDVFDWRAPGRWPFRGAAVFRGSVAVDLRQDRSEIPR